MAKTVLVTGASTGFGRLTAEMLAAAGCNVIAAMRSPTTKNREHALALRKLGVSVCELDVTDDDSVEQAVAAIAADAGRIDVLVNNAGIASAGVSEAFTARELAALFDVNVFGVHRMMRAVLPLMRDRKDGLIINVGSILGRVTFPFFGHYGASKFAVEAMTDSYRYEVSQFGIDVCLVQPSAYPTQMYGSAMQPADIEAVESYGEIGKIPAAMFEQFSTMLSGDDAPDPQDVAKAIGELIKTKKGARPERVVVGAGFGADAINEATRPVQAQVVEGLGLGHLAKVKKGLFG